MPKFCPENYKPNQRTIEFAKSKGLSDKQIAVELEKMMDHEFRRGYTDWNRVFRNWVRKAIEIGSVSVVTPIDDDAAELGLTRQPGETDESLRRRMQTAQMFRDYPHLAVER